MKKAVVIVFMAALMCTFCAASAAQVPDIDAKAAILIDGGTGRVLWGKGARERLPMASTTKIMTALVVLENCALGEQVTVDASASGVEGSSIYLEVGETLSVEELLLGLLLKSGNDAAVALAIHTSGSVEAFVEKMNERAAALGLQDTHFDNPHGLDSATHYTTAYDLAMIAREAMGNEDFRRIVATQRAVISWEGHEWDRVLTNHNKILSLVEGGCGIKTGFTRKAGRCLVSAAEREGMTLIAVTLCAADDFARSALLLEYGFDTFSPFLLAREGETLGIARTADGTRAVCSPKDIVAALSEGERAELRFDIPGRSVDGSAGSAAVLIDGEEICSFPLITKNTLKYGSFADILYTIICRWQVADGA